MNAPRHSNLIACLAAAKRGFVTPRLAISIARGVSFSISNSTACPTEQGIAGVSIVRASVTQLYLTGPTSRRLGPAALSLILSSFPLPLFASSATDIM